MKLTTQKQKRINDMNERCDKMTRKLVNALIVLLALLIILNLLVII